MFATLLKFVGFRWLSVCLAILISSAPALAQQEGDENEAQGTEGVDEQADDSSGSSGWRPHGGSLFGSSRPPQMTTSEDDLTGGTTQPEEEASEDARTELLVFDLYYEDGISFRDRYLEEFEEAFNEALEASPTYRPLTSYERQRRMTAAAQLHDRQVTDDRAEEIAIAIDAPYYLIPRVEIESRSSYRISMTLGEAGRGEEGRTVFSETVGRRVDRVEHTIAHTTTEAVAGPVE